MSKNFLKRFLVLLIILAALFSSAACSDVSEPVVDAEVNSTLLRIGDNIIPLKKALILILGHKDLMEETYGSEIWNISMDEENFDDYLKDKIKTRIGLIFAGSCLARDNKITLGPDEEKLSRSAANYLYAKLSDNDKNELKLTVDDLFDIYTSYRLAICGYEQLIEEAGIEVSRDEARVIRIYQIKVSKTGLSGADLSLKKASVNEAYQRIIGGEDFLTVAAGLNESADTELSVARGILGAEEEKVAFSLNKGEISTPFETEDSIVIFKCVESYDEAKSEAARITLVSEKKSAYYIDALTAYLEQNPLTWNEQAWSSIDLSAISYKTDSNFFGVYDMFFPELEDGGN